MIVICFILAWLLINTYITLAIVTYRTYLEFDMLNCVVLCAVFSYPLTWCIAKLIYLYFDYKYKKENK